jgi:hypothetical protein
MGQYMFLGWLTLIPLLNSFRLLLHLCLHACAFLARNRHNLQTEIQAKAEYILIDQDHAQSNMETNFQHSVLNQITLYGINYHEHFY